MRRGSPFVIATVVTASVAGPVDARVRTGCPLHRSAEITDVFVGTRAVLYVRTPAGLDLRYGVSFACDRRTGTRWELNGTDPLFGPDGGVRVDPRSVAVGGPYAAWSGGGNDGSGVWASVNILDVRTGASMLVMQRYPDAPNSGHYYFVRLALRPSGALAWSARGRGIFACRHCFSTADANSRRPVVEQLAGADGVRLGSLRVTPRGVAWQQAGHDRHHRLR